MSNQTDRLLTDNAFIEFKAQETQRLQAIIGKLTSEGLQLARQRLFNDSVLVLYRVLGIAQASEISGAEASALHNIAVVLGTGGNVDQAIAVLENAISICKSQTPGDPRLQQYEAHMQVFQRKATNDRLRLMQAQSGSLLFHNDEISALAILRKARAEAKTVENPCLEMSLLIDQVNIYGSLDDPQAGLALLCQAEELKARLSESEAATFQIIIDKKVAYLNELAQSRAFRELLQEVIRLDNQGDMDGAFQKACAAIDESARTFGGQHYLTAVGMNTAGIALMRHAAGMESADERQDKLQEALAYFQHATQVALEWPESAAGILANAVQHEHVCQAMLNRNGEGESENLF